MNPSNSLIQQQQFAALKQLGRQLAQTREQRQRELEHVASRTYIPIEQLAALEAADLTQLPPPAEIQPLIRQYANVLGLNGVRLAAEFPLKASPLADPSRSWMQKYAQLRLRPAQLYGAYILVAIGLIQGLSLLLQPPTPQLSTQPIGQPIAQPKAALRQASH